MTLREEMEKLEHQQLSPKASFSDESRGRLHPEEGRIEDVRTCYQRDTDKIVHSKAFRRLMHKTQVFLSPEGDHYRTRMTHTLEVSRIARTIAKALDLMARGNAPDEFELLLRANARPTATEKGTATHMFLQYCDWSRVYAKGIEEEISRLLAEGFMTQRAAQILDRKQLQGFFDSPFAARARTATRMLRELKFQRFIPLRELTSNQDLAMALGDRTLYVRGSIDLLLEFEDGHIEICDYKTDHITKEEKQDPLLLKSHLAERHATQLKQYAAAVEALYQQRPTAIYIYSLPFGDALEIPV